MGITSPTMNPKQKYLKIIQNKKQAYCTQKKNILKYFYSVTWKTFIVATLKDLSTKNSYPWLDPLIFYSENWDQTKVIESRINAIWFDYLHSHSRSSQAIQKTKSSLDLQLSLEDPDDIFESCSLFEFLHKQFQKSETNFIGGFIVIFKQYFIRLWKESYNNAKGALKEIFKQLKDFIKICTVSLGCYYGGVIIEKLQKSYNEIYNLLVEEILDQNMQEILFKFFQKEEKEVIFIDKSMSCEECGIKSEFQLVGLKNPYEKAIDVFKNIETTLSPIKKAFWLNVTSKMICECVDEYWIGKDVGGFLIDTDQTIGIFLYIILQAKVPYLKYHLEVIKEMVTLGDEDANLEYYVKTLQGCLSKLEGKFS